MKNAGRDDDDGRACNDIFFFFPAEIEFNLRPEFFHVHRIWAEEVKELRKIMFVSWSVEHVRFPDRGQC